jgi:hypothetical protein
VVRGGLIWYGGTGVDRVAGVVMVANGGVFVLFGCGVESRGGGGRRVDAIVSGI